MIVGHRQMHPGRGAGWGNGVKPLLGAARQGAASVRPTLLFTTPISRMNTPRLEAGADRLGEGLLGGEALGVGAGAGEGAALRLGALAS
jgi:hypothetical protein